MVVIDDTTHFVECGIAQDALTRQHVRSNTPEYVTLVTQR